MDRLNIFSDPRSQTPGAFARNFSIQTPANPAVLSVSGSAGEIAVFGVSYGDSSNVAQLQITRRHIGSR